jgi:high mobility group protein 20A
VRYINEHRERIRQKNSGLESIEITKLVAEEWRKLSEDKKKPYLDAADIDKERYHRECDEYKQSEAKKAKIDKSSSEPVKSKLTTPETKTTTTLTPTAMTNGSRETPMIKPQRTDYDIPIFTDEFLEHNKVKDQDLRNLRKSNTDYEQQNSVLEKHVENMKNGIDKLEMETTSLRTNNATLQGYLDKLRSTLANSALQTLAIPSKLK